MKDFTQVNVRRALIAPLRPGERTWSPQSCISRASGASGRRSHSLGICRARPEVHFQEGAGRHAPGRSCESLPSVLAMGLGAAAAGSARKASAVVPALRPDPGPRGEADPAFGLWRVGMRQDVMPGPHDVEDVFAELLEQRGIAPHEVVEGLLGDLLRKRRRAA